MSNALVGPVRGRFPVVQPSLLDRAVGFVSPAAGLRRLESRVRMQAALGIFGGGQYNGARGERKAMRNWWPRLGGPNSDSVGDLPVLRARSADLERNEPLATGGINTIVTTTVGIGLRATSMIDAEFLGLSEVEADAWEREADRIWEYVSDSKRLDVAGRYTFGQLQELALRAQLVRGDAFAVRRWRENAGDLVATKVMLFEGDRVSNPVGRINASTFIEGVELDRDGRHLRYYVRDEHPGDSPVFSDWKPVDVYGKESGDLRALHISRALRPGQVRGIPVLAPVIELLKQLGRYTEAELMAAVISSFFTVFVKTQAGEDTGLLPDMTPTDAESLAAGAQTPTDTRDVNMGPGQVVSLLNGEDVTFADPGRPNAQFDPFVLAILRQIGVALELPFEFLVKHFTSSYSASRAALLEAWRSVLTRRSWLVADFCQPVREWVIEEAILRGHLKAPGFFENPLIRAAYLHAEWTGPSMGQLNPVQEVEAAAKRVDNGFSTRAEETAQLTGGSWERKHRQRVKEERMRREGGLAAEGVAERIVTEPVTPQPPAKEPADPNENDKADQEEQRDAA